MATNQGVVGSIPASRANKINGLAPQGASPLSRLAPNRVSGARSVPVGRRLRRRNCRTERGQSRIGRQRAVRTKPHLVVGQAHLDPVKQFRPGATSARAGAESPAMLPPWEYLPGGAAPASRWHALAATRGCASASPSASARCRSGCRAPSSAGAGRAAGSVWQVQPSCTSA